MSSNEVILGITAPVPKGEWVSTETYQYLNIVNYGSASYMAIRQNSGIEPESHASWKSYWVLLCKGLPGVTGAKLIKQELIGQDANGGNIYQQTFDDDTIAYFTAPRGEKGEDGEASSKLPDVTTADNGKILQVVNGAWSASALEIYSGEYEVLE